MEIDFKPRATQIVINGIAYYIKPCDFMIDGLLQVIKHIHVTPAFIELSSVLGASVASFKCSQSQYEALINSVKREYPTWDYKPSELVLDMFVPESYRRFLLLEIIRLNPL